MTLANAAFWILYCDANPEECDDVNFLGVLAIVVVLLALLVVVSWLLDRR